MRRRIGWMILWVVLLTLSSRTLFAQERWVYRCNPGNGDDWAASIVMASDGNLYAAGRSDGTSYDFTVVSLTASGGERWVYRYDGPANGYDWAYSIVMGSDGNLYAAGMSYGIGTAEDFTVVSLTDSGAERWVYRYNGPGNSYDAAYPIVMGSDGNLYAAGQSYGLGTSRDFTVVSLTDSGAERWVYRYDGPAHSYDVASSIVMGSDGNLYAAGWSRGIGTSRDFTVVSLTASGGERWVYRYNGPGNSDDGASSIVMGSDGNLYAAGRSDGSGTSSDFTVVSLTDSGGERWIYQYNGPANGDDWVHSIVMGSDGNLYAAGMSYGIGTAEDFTVVSLTDSGGERWIYRYNDPADTTDVANSIVMGSDGNLYAAGESYGIGTSDDFTVVSLTDSGAERWVYRYNGSGNGMDRAESIVMGSDGNLYAAGVSWGSGTAEDFTVVSLTRDVGVEEKDRRAPESPVLQMSVCPIPASSGVRIYYSLPKATEVRLSIYDVCGRLVRNLVNTREESGSRVILWDAKDSEEKRVASGTYFVRLEAFGFCASRKFILL